MEAQAPLVLEYSTGSTAGGAMVVPRWLRYGLLAIWLAGVVSPFIPFVAGVSPLIAMQAFHTYGGLDVFPMLAAPFFLTIPAAMWKLRTAWSGPRRWEVAAAILIGAVAMADVVWLVAGVVRPGGWGGLWEATKVLWPAPLALGWGGGLLALALTRGRSGHTSAGMLAIITPYMANAGMCLSVFADWPGPVLLQSHNWGYRLTAILVAAGAVEMAWLTAWLWRHRKA